MRYLPLHFDLQGRTVLVVGGGELARRKVDLLLRSGAGIELVAPEISDELFSMLTSHTIHQANYESSRVNNQALVVAATNNPAVNEAVSIDARARNIPVNVVDAPELSTVTFPAIIDRDPLIVSVGSSATSPVLTRYVRQLIEQTLPEGLSAVASYLGQVRDRLKEVFPDIEMRRRQTENFLESPGYSAAESGDFKAAERYLFDKENESLAGEVYVVGAGPGDPDLLTLKALQLMQKADVVLYDNLVSPGVLDRVRRDARMEFVGKRSGYKSTSQEHINDMLVRLANEGHRVLRLKGGDPFVFGRGGEEIIALIQQQIPFQVVPGITAALGCATYAGIPLTHRDLSQSVRFVTGHPKDGEVDLPWQELTHENETIVFYMGLSGLSSICQQLVKHGRRHDTPAAIISKGTTPEQQVLKGTLETLPGLVARTQILSPTIVIVGDVVNFADQVSS
ncbi:MAG: uroporphyrinogen-III C-methyltransferase [Gammaproteobacteria bacterium]|jgi:uroporphyrin-III C-methyltransferase / precorrin-2 dehydrogenase / sirohydrochlorin ferrochelatase|nr:uroporphyrinogen-III C-methyltransferase [Gammaproteobacteria bacterium]MBT7370777.1 uroporphyrinogen-III C-methyltransferase [Gammaproteobacteria bacterium]